MKKNPFKIPILTILLCLSTILVTSITSPTNFVASRTYTADADFDEGVLSGLEHDTIHDQLQLTKQQIIFPFIWVPNNEGTISKVHAETGKELARYRIAPFMSKPSRTAVDQQGSCWVGNTIGGTVLKIGLYEADQWIDRNSDGICQTSQDANNDGIITEEEILPWGADECVLYEVALLNGREGTFVPATQYDRYDMNEWGTSPRGLAIDVDNNLWVGTYLSMKYYYINGSTGVILSKVDVSHLQHRSLGAVIDKNGILWSSGENKPYLLRLDPSTNPPLLYNVYCGHPAYGLGLDNLDHLFVSHNENNYLSRINILTGSLEWHRPGSELYGGRGVACTSDNDVWVVNRNNGYTFRYDNNGNMKRSYSVYNGPTGVSVDALGKVWVVGELPSSPIMRINPLTNTVDLQKTIFGTQGHNGYNEMTGAITQTTITPVGTWTVIFDSGWDDTPWEKLFWTSYEPADTSVTVKVRSSNDQISWSPWETALNAIPLSTTPNGRYLQIEVLLELNSGITSPILYDLSVEPGNSPPRADVGGPYLAEEGSAVIFDASGTVDPDGDILNYAWDLDGDGLFDDGTQSTTSATWDDDYFGDVAVSVFDGEYTDIATTTVTILNVAPTVSIVEIVPEFPDMIAIGDILQVVGTFSDPGLTDTHTIEWDFGDGTFVTGNLMPIHVYTAPGIYTITLTVTDDDDGVGSDSIQITVGIRNQSPVADAGGPYVGDEGSPVTLDASGSSDPDGDALLYRWDLDNDGIWDTSYSSDPTLTITWVDDISAAVSVEVHDGEYTDIGTTTVTILNVAPIASIIDIVPEFPDMIAVGDTLEVIGTFFDPGLTDTHTIEWDFGDGTFVTDTLTPTHVYTAPGVYTITLTVTDKDDGVGTDSLTLTVEIRNQPPVADAGGPYIGDEGSPVTLDASGSSDPDGDALLYRWDLDNDGIWDTSYSPDPTLTITWIDNFSGSVSVEVHDGEYSDIATTTITILNVAPIASIIDIVPEFPDMIAVGDTLEVIGTFFDPGLTDTHTIEWDFGDGTLITDTLTPTHVYTAPGVYTITLTVKDNDGGIGSESITLIVEVRNYPPIANAGGPYIGDEGSPVTLNASGSSDPDGDALLYRWDLDNDGIWDTSYSSDPTLTITWIDDFCGSVSVEIFDGEYTAIATTTLTILNVAPVAIIEEIVQPFPDFILINDNLEIYGSFFDSGLVDSHTIEWDFGDGTILTDVLTPTHVYSDPGVFTNILTVIDDDGGIGSDSLTLVIWGSRDLKESVITILEAAKTDYQSINNQLDSIICRIEWSLNEKFWIDDLHLNLKFGTLVFAFEYCAVVKMEQLTRKFSRLIPKIEQKIQCMKEKGFDITCLEAKLEAMVMAQAAFESIMFRLTKADELLANRLFEEVKEIQIECPKYRKIVERLLLKAERFLISAQEHFNDNQYKRAIRDYALAWCFARIALFHANRCLV